MAPLQAAIYDYGAVPDYPDGLTLDEESELTIASGTATQTGVIDDWHEDSPADYGITKTGEGTLVFAAQNRYGGATRVEAGTLRIGVDDALSADSALIVNGGTFDLAGRQQSVASLGGAGGTLALGNGGPLYINMTGTGTFAGAITGGEGSSIGMNDTGTLTLSGNSVVEGYLSIYAGRIISVGADSRFANVQISAGEFTVAGGKTVSEQIYVDSETHAMLAVTNGGVLDVAGGTIYAAAYQAQGSVLVSGSGSLLLAEGLDVGGDGSGVVTLAEGGKASLYDSYYEKGTLHLGNGPGSGASGSLNIGAATGQAAAAPGVLDADNVTTGDGTGRIVFNHTSTAYAFTRDGTAAGEGVAISGKTGVVQESGVTLLLAESTYTGGTLVAGGTLIIRDVGEGSALGSGAVEVANPGTLAGEGRVSGDAVISGVLAPGSIGLIGSVSSLDSLETLGEETVGHLDFRGDLTLEAVATLEIGLAGAEEFDRITVRGAFAYGGTLNISLLDGFTPEDGASFALFAVDGSNSGAFSSIAVDGFLGEMDYATGTLTLHAIPEPSPLSLGGLTALGSLVAACLRRRRHG